MIRRIVIIRCVIALVFPLTLTGCNMNESAKLKAALEQTETERDDLRAKIAVVTQSRDQLQEQVNEFTQARDKLQQQINELTKSRDIAVAGAQKSQDEISRLSSQLQAEVQKVRELQDQQSQVLIAIAELQNKLKS
jgi:uncharacterized coiled-coil DUF342 family protein